MTNNTTNEQYNDSRLKMLTMKYQELSWLSSLQTLKGAIALDLSPSGNKSGLFLSPYFGAIAAQGFLTNPTTYHRCKNLSLGILPI